MEIDKFQPHIKLVINVLECSKTWEASLHLIAVGEKSDNGQCQYAIMPLLTCQMSMAQVSIITANTSMHFARGGLTFAPHPLKLGDVLSQLIPPWGLSFRSGGTCW